MGFYKDSNYSGQTVTIKNWCSTQRADGTHDPCDPCYHPTSYIYVMHGVPTQYSLFGKHYDEITTPGSDRPPDPGYAPPTPPPLIVYLAGSQLRKYSGLQGLLVEFVVDGRVSFGPTSTTWAVHWAYGGTYNGEPDGLLYLNGDAFQAAQQSPDVISGKVPLIYSGDPSTPFGSDPSWEFPVIFHYSYILAIPA